METVLITGGIGYLGGRLLAALNGSGRQIRATTRRPEKKQPAWTVDLDIRIADILDAEALAAACDGVDTVIHLAALNAGQCASNPVLARRVNVDGTQILVAAAQAAGVKRLIYFSTAHVYGSPLSGVIDENTPTSPAHPYANTHADAEEIVRNLDKLDSLVLRLSNGVGAPMDADIDGWMLIANDLCRQAVCDHRITLRGSGLDDRDFVPIYHVCNTVQFFLDCPTPWNNESYNLGSGHTTTTQELAETIADRCAKTIGHLPQITRKDSTPEETSSPLSFRVDKLAKAGCAPQADLTGEIDATLVFCRNRFINE
ncbi:MAG: NAD(P)-dependent oxidoreductase [Planctomycetaceae bacterium]|jgi:UDP-glucose 4-epimerase|nr:NAD(P)-dependent oxidoreductase [Planctomycetaceae bacterium]